MRPNPAGVEVARALIARVKAADSIIKRADELLVCAAVASRSGEFGGVPTVCARAMGKTISKPKRVNEWIARLEKLEQALATETGSGLLVQPAWIEQHVPGIRELTVAPMVISPGNKRPGTRSIDAVSSTPLGSTRTKRATGDYTLPPSQGERESEGKRRNPRRVAHLKMKVRTVGRRVTITSRSAVTNLTWNLSTPTTQSMSTIQMTQTDADAHLFCFPRCHVYFVLASVGSR